LRFFSEEYYGNGEQSAESIVEKSFINPTNSIAKNLSITSSTKIRKKKKKKKKKKAMFNNVPQNLLSSKG